MAKPWWNRRAASVPELLAQTLIIGVVLLCARLLFDDSASDAFLYSALFVLVSLLVGVALLWNDRRA
jgi:hypothetical protein